MAKQIGDGTTISFGDSGFDMELTSITWTGASRGFSDSSTLSTTTWRDKIAHSLTDPGGLDLEGAYDGTIEPPITEDAETITITFAGSSTISFSGFITDFQCTAALGELNTFTCHVEASSTVSFG